MPILEHTSRIKQSKNANIRKKIASIVCLVHVSIHPSFLPGHHPASLLLCVALATATLDTMPLACLNMNVGGQDRRLEDLLDQEV